MDSGGWEGFGTSMMNVFSDELAKAAIDEVLGSPEWAAILEEADSTRMIPPGIVTPLRVARRQGQRRLRVGED